MTLVFHWVSAVYIDIHESQVFRNTPVIADVYRAARLTGEVFNLLTLLCFHQPHHKLDGQG